MTISSPIIPFTLEEGNNIPMEEDAPIMLHRVSIAWFLLSASVSTYALWTIVHKLSSPLSPRYRIRTGMAMVVIGTMSNGLQLVYQLFPEGDSITTPLWLIIDGLDYCSYAASLSLYILIAWWRAKVIPSTMPPMPLWKRWFMSFVRSKLLVTISSVCITLSLLLSFLAIYLEDALCPLRNYDKCEILRRWYLFISQIIVITGEILFALMYITTWDEFSRITCRASSRPDIRSMFVILGMLATVALQLLLLLDGFLSIEIWLGSRLLWMAYTTILISVIPIYLLQLQLVSECMNDPGVNFSDTSAHGTKPSALVVGSSSTLIAVNEQVNHSNVDIQQIGQTVQVSTHDSFICCQPNSPLDRQSIPFNFNASTTQLASVGTWGDQSLHYHGPNDHWSPPVVMMDSSFNSSSLPTDLSLSLSSDRMVQRLGKPLTDAMTGPVTIDASSSSSYPIAISTPALIHAQGPTYNVRTASTSSIDTESFLSIMGSVTSWSEYHKGDHLPCC